MISFENLLSRADTPVIDSLLPKGAGEIIKYIDPGLMYSGNLKKLLLDLISPQTLLLTKTSRNQLIDLLPEGNAIELSQQFKGGGLDSYVFLKDFKFTKVSDKKKLLAYFRQDYVEEIQQRNTPEENVECNYELFSHQISALSSVRRYLNNDAGRVLLHMPTGSGKTRTAVSYASEYLRAEKNRVVVWLANSEELCEQAFQEFKKAWSYLGNRKIKCIRYWAKYNSNLEELKDGFVVIGLPKAYAKLVANDLGIRTISSTNPLVIFDEAHQVVARTYKQITELLLRPYSTSRLLGLSATPGRSWNDPEKDEELTDFFGRNKVTLSIDGYSNPVTYLIENEYLARPTFRKIMSGVSLCLTPEDEDKISDLLDIPSSVLQKLGESHKRNLLVVQETCLLLKKHSRVLVFSASVAQSDLLATVLRAKRVNAKSITSNTSDFDRLNYINAYKSDNTENMVLCNYGILTTGFDAPKTSAALIARPTTPLVLYSQMIGRALRGKKAGGNLNAEIVTVIDEGIEAFNSIESAFSNWEDVWTR